MDKEQCEKTKKTKRNKTKNLLTEYLKLSDPNGILFLRYTNTYNKLTVN